MATVRQQVLECHRKLRSLAERPDEWIRSAAGTDLWIDGLVAVRSTARDRLTRYLDAFLDYSSRSGLPLRSPADWRPAAHLALFDSFLSSCADQDSRCFWHALAMGMCLVQAAGGPPRVEMSDAATINDTLLFVLSPNYRGIRIAAYNAGVRTLAKAGEKAPLFRPEFGSFLVYPAYLTDGKPPIRSQFYVVNHDLAHITLFADVYLRPIGNPAVTAALLLNVEETSCTVDLVLAGEMRRFGVDLQAFRELSRLEQGWEEGKESVLDCAARSPERFEALQAGFKAWPQRYLPTTPISAGMAAVPIPPDLGDWCRPETQRAHAEWAEKLARRIWNPVFQRFVGLLPPQPGQLENAYRFMGDVWKRGELIFPVAEPSGEERERNVSLYRLRYLVIRAAELAVKLSKAGLATEELLDDLTAWALAVVSDFARAKRESFELHAAAVRALLARHRVEDGGGKLSALFEDHVERQIPEGPDGLRMSRGLPFYRSTQ